MLRSLLINWLAVVTAGTATAWTVGATVEFVTEFVSYLELAQPREMTHRTLSYGIPCSFLAAPVVMWTRSGNQSKDLTLRLLSCGIIALCAGSGAALASAVLIKSGLLQMEAFAGTVPAARFWFCRMLDYGTNLGLAAAYAGFIVIELRRPCRSFRDGCHSGPGDSGTEVVT